MPADKVDSVMPPAPVPPGEEHSFARAVDGTRLFVRSKNDHFPADATRALFCDGILCDGFIWKYLWNDLAPLMPLSHWHYRGHGRSAKPKDPDRIDIAAHADDLNSVREHLGGPPLVLIGHSMGCQIALEAWRRHPGSVRALILQCGTFGRVTSTFHGGPILEMLLPRLLDTAEKVPQWVRAIWSRIPVDMALKIALKMKEIDPTKIRAEDVLPYFQNMTHMDFPMFLKMLRAAGEHSAEAYLRDIDVPVLVIAGERDTFTPAFLAESMAKQIPNAELLMVPQGTHVAALEQPEFVNARIGEFLRSKVLTG